MIYLLLMLRQNMSMLFPLILMRMLR